jgi:hypothetical protein
METIVMLRNAAAAAVTLFFAYSSPYQVERMQGPGQIHVVYL